MSNAKPDSDWDQISRQFHMGTPSDAADTLARARAEMAAIDNAARFTPNVLNILKWVHVLIARGAQHELDRSGVRPS